jgi:nicotinamide-nucleotide amidase
MPPRNRRQAMVLKGAEVVPNALGTAPGQMIRIGKKLVVLLPGPARELMPMVESAVFPRLKEIFPGHYSIQKTFLIFGVPESRIDEIIRPWVARRNRLNGCRVIHGILASQLIITVKFTVEGKNPADVQAASRQLSSEIKKLLGDTIYGEGKDTLESVVGARLRSRKLTVAVAESCTGGLISRLLTEPAGASDYFIEGAVTYSNASKMKRLGVRAETLRKFGAVSQQAAREMAQGMKRSAPSDYALSVTGIAGPTGASPGKPVGLVFIGLAGPKGTAVRKFIFKGDRSAIRYRTALVAIDLLRKELLAR